MYLSAEEIKAYRPYPAVRPSEGGGPLGRTRRRMEEAAVWSPNQVLGRRNIIGCVALEITQRCNLDCSLCYLSEHSESTKDIPLEEVFRRMDLIRFHYGPETDVQITGGDPTLRKRDELLAIVRRVRELGMNPTLMTNGKLATRDLLTALRDAGMKDVAFHVDLTQERKGYATEEALNEVRQQYIERARGLGLFVIFNTTVFEGNFAEIPALVRFFRRNVDVVGMASFQLQADTGRGVLRERAALISLDSVAKQIETGAETKISFESLRIGHPECHRYGLVLSAGGKLFDLFDHLPFVEKFLEATKTWRFDRSSYNGTFLRSLGFWLGRPELWWDGAKFLVSRLWRMRRELVASRGEVRKITFFMHNFMDAKQLAPDRVHACSFMAMTGDGPISMCMHNAKRDEFILKPVALASAPGKTWNPLTGQVESGVAAPISG